ncbi:MAG TPA: penicillin-insensitive murein endopeptidase [Miltoncostaeaceae bacterium]|nr:penicillin-insensitive murein endopeptidase [Miltoncostaeaceae bacterium]
MLGRHSRHRRRAARHCCPACAASLGRRRRGPGQQPWMWVSLLALVAALVPLAAFEGDGEASVARAAGAVVQVEPAPPTPAPRPGTPEKTPERSPGTPPPKPARPAVEWRDSIAHGSPNGGWLENGIRLPSQGPGFYTYDPATQRPPGGADRQWGTAVLVRQLLDLGAWWEKAHPGAPRLGIGDLSRRHGGPFGGPAVGHASHQNGLDVDIRLPRGDGREDAADPGTYDRALTQQVVDRLVAQGASLVLIGPSLDLHGPGGVVVRWPAHDDHLHVRFPDPDGTGN